MRKKLRLAYGTGQDQDISDSIAFLHAARKLLQQQKTHVESVSVAASIPPCRTPAAAGEKTTNATPSSGGDADSARSSSGGGWVSRLLSLGGSAGSGKKEDDKESEEAAFEDAEEIDFEDTSEPEVAAGQAESPAGQTESYVRAEAPEPIAVPRLCVFPLPIDDGQVQMLIEKLDGLLGQMEVDKEEIDASWVRLVEKVDFKTDMTSFEDTLRFIRLLKLQTQAIKAEYGFLMQIPTADRAITRISTAASDCIKALDASKPEEAITVLRNLNELCTMCPRVIDDDKELQDALTTSIAKRRVEAHEWVAKLEKDLADKGVDFYAKAERQPDSAERKKLIHEVSKSLDLHLRLQEKLVSVQLRDDIAAEAPLVKEIKKRIEGMHTDIQQRLRTRGSVTADDIAKTLHTMYVTAFDLGQTSILKHAETCITGILQDCKGRNGLTLQEVGIVLERDLPQGGEIIANIPQFAELNLVQFQEMTAGKTVEGTVEEVVKLNKLAAARAKRLLDVVKEIYSAYERTYGMGKFHRDYPRMVRSVKNTFNLDKSIPGLIGGVFGIWSMSSISEQCPTPRRPLAAQVVAVARLLSLDKPGMPQGIFTMPQGIFNRLGLVAAPEPSIDASHLAQIKTGQGKSVVLGTLATVLCIVGFQ